LNLLRSISVTCKKIPGIFRVLIGIICFTIIVPLIANDQPLYISNDSAFGFPALNPHGSAVINLNNSEIIIIYQQIDWKSDTLFNKIFALIPWSPNKTDVLNANYIGPASNNYRLNQNGNKLLLTGSERHLLGTSKRGEDVFSGLLHGSRVSISVGLFSMLITGFIGIFLGAMAGFFGDDKLKLSSATLFTSAILAIPFWFYCIQLSSEYDSKFYSVLVCSSFILIFIGLKKFLNRFEYYKRSVSIPADLIILKLIEILASMPRLILIIVIAAVITPSVQSLILIIGLTSWTEIARITRAEMLSAKGYDYIEAARAQGTGDMRLIFKHAIPNIISPAIVVLVFGISGAIMTESGLSFLGIGVPQDVVTWGSLLAAGKEHFQAWWLIIFPGLALFGTIYFFNSLGEYMQRVLVKGR